MINKISRYCQPKKNLPTTAGRFFYDTRSIFSADFCVCKFVQNHYFIFFMSL